MGFSQGAYLALQMGLFLAEQQQPCAGIMAYAGWMGSRSSTNDLGDFPPILLVHGTADTVVPLAGSLQAAAFFEEKGKYCEPSLTNAFSITNGSSEATFDWQSEFSRDGPLAIDNPHAA